MGTMLGQLKLTGTSNVEEELLEQFSVNGFSVI